MNYVQNLYKITKPGGYAYASVHSPCGQKNMIDYFLARKNTNALYPGFFVMNRIHHYRHDAKANINRCTNVERVEMFEPLSSDISPIKVVEGFYQSQQAVEFDHKFQDGANTYKVRCHSAAHMFDPDSLSYFFKEVGFEIEEAFFIDVKGKKVDRILSVEEMSNNLFGVGIVARKPL